MSTQQGHPAVIGPNEHVSDYCGPCRCGVHARCYEPCKCRDKGHRCMEIEPAAKLVPVHEAREQGRELGRREAFAQAVEWLKKRSVMATAEIDEECDGPDADQICLIAETLDAASEGLANWVKGGCQDVASENVAPLIEPAPESGRFTPGPDGWAYSPETGKQLAQPIEPTHDADCQCDLFSDLHKDVTGYRPRGEWSCQRVKEWHAENYIETRPGYFEPRVPFKE